MIQKKIIILMGPPGVGKGTLSQYFKQKHDDMDHVAIGSVLRKLALSHSALGKRIKDLIDAGNFLDDDTIHDIAEEVFHNFLFESDSKNTLLLDGFPRSKNQFELFLNLYKKYKDYFNYKVLFLGLSRDKLKKRLLNRYVCTGCDQIYSFNVANFDCDNFSCEKCHFVLTKRKDDDLEVIEKRLNLYFDQEESIFSFLKNNFISYSSYENNDGPIATLGELICSEFFCA